MRINESAHAGGSSAATVAVAERKPPSSWLLWWRLTIDIFCRASLIDFTSNCQLYFTPTWIQFRLNFLSLSLTLSLSLFLSFSFILCLYLLPVLFPGQFESILNISSYGLCEPWTYLYSYHFWDDCQLEVYSFLSFFLSFFFDFISGIVSEFILKELLSSLILTMVICWLVAFHPVRLVTLALY